jgi:hypothetical protein
MAPKRGHAVLDQQGNIARISGTKGKGTQFYIDTAGTTSIKAWFNCHRIAARDLTQIKPLKPRIVWRFAGNFVDLEN